MTITHGTQKVMQLVYIAEDMYAECVVCAYEMRLCGGLVYRTLREFNAYACLDVGVMLTDCTTDSNEMYN